jgi:NADH-quinone oxidoreductase subunit C
LSSADAPTEVSETPETPTDEARQSLLDAVTAELGDAVVGSHLDPGRDLWIRVSAEAWAHTADYLRNRQRFRFFNWLSAVDWLPSPFGRGLDAAVDKLLGVESGAAEETHDEGTELAEPEGGGAPVYASGVAGGDTRFQVLARVHNLTTGIGLSLKVDVPPDTLTLDTWTKQYAGADWHERETYEMFGISFAGHPSLRKLYLPTDFEGHPLRKDFPLLSRLIKPWPGIVDVEPMPVPDEPAGPVGEAGAVSTENTEDAS